MFDHRPVVRQLTIYGLAILFPALAFLARQEFSAVAEHGRYFLHFASIVIISLYGGLGPGLLAIVISVLGSYFFFLLPMSKFPEQQHYSFFLLMLFTAVSILTACIAAKLRKSMQVAKDAVAARSELMAVVSHDLKNPLSAILLKRQALLRIMNGSGNGTGGSDGGKVDLEFVRRQVDSMGASAEQMNRLIQDILDMETIEQGHLKIEMKPEDLSVIFAAIAEIFGSIAQNKTIQLRIQQPHVPILVNCDRGRILQVISNLLGNAIKFTAEGGHAEVETQLLPDDGVKILIRDNGPGIRPEYLKRIFDRHWQVETTAKFGHGLGLFIAKGIIEAHGSQIFVESEPGRGSTFYFTLRRSAALPKPVLAQRA